MPAFPEERGVLVWNGGAEQRYYGYELRFWCWNSSYDPTGPIQVIYKEGRNSLAINTFASPLVLAFLNDFIKFTGQSQA